MPEFRNNVRFLLEAPLSEVATSIALSQNQIDALSSVPDSSTITLTFTQGALPETSWEIISCQFLGGNLYFLQRGIENTTEQAWPTGTKVELRLTAGQFADAYNNAELAFIFLMPKATNSSELGSVSGAVNFTYSAGHKSFARLSTAGNVSLTFTEQNSETPNATIRMHITVNGTDTVSFPAGTLTPGGAQLAFSGGGKTDSIEVFLLGGTVEARFLEKDIAPIL